METTFTWELKVKNTPLLIKKCSHCDSERYYCSDKFRMNAQKKNIDVCLIYRCVKCDNTCNVTLLSRTKPDMIEKTLFHKFSVNDRKTAWRYAFSAELAGKNNMKLDYEKVEYEVKDDFLEEDINSDFDKIIKVQIRCEFYFNLKLSSLIKNKLLLSGTQLKRLFEQGEISLVSGKDPQKHKVRNGDVILIKCKHLLGRML